MTDIIVFGDSITAGAWDKEEGGWVQRLTKYLYSRSKDYFIYNCSISGDTTEDLLDRAPLEIKARASEDCILIFQIGTNDSQIYSKSGKQRISPDEFRKNLQKLIDLAKRYSSKTVFLGLTPIDQPKVDPIPWAADWSYTEQSRDEYNQVIKSVCEKNKIHFINLYDDKSLLDDGVHPNSKGHQRIFEAVKEFIIKNKII